MKVETTGNRISVFAGNMQQEKISVQVPPEDGKKGEKLNAVYAQNLNPIFSDLEAKKSQAQKEALKIVKDAFEGDRQIDEDLKKRSLHIKELQGAMKEARGELAKLEARKAELAAEYRVDSDSQEQKDLELLEIKAAIDRGKRPEGLTKEDYARMKELEGRELTEYQKRAMELDGYAAVYENEIEKAEEEIYMENAIIRGVCQERLKSDPMADAQKEADAILEEASREQIALLIEETRDSVEEDMKEKKEAAEKQKEKREELTEKLQENNKEKRQKEEMRLYTENMLRLETIQEEVQTEVRNVVDKMKLTVEDIKGSVVDEQR